MKKMDLNVVEPIKAFMAGESVFPNDYIEVS